MNEAILCGDVRKVTHVLGVHADDEVTWVVAVGIPTERMDCNTDRVAEVVDRNLLQLELPYTALVRSLHNRMGTRKAEELLVVMSVVVRRLLSVS